MYDKTSGKFLSRGFEKERYPLPSKMEGIDVVLGSVHYPVFSKGDPLTSFNIDNKELLVQLYFENMLLCLNDFKDDFDVLAHLDFIKVFDLGNIDEHDIYTHNKDIIAEILELVIKNNKSLELNGKLNQRLAPSIDVLKLYKDLGGRDISIGSDSHKLEGFGCNYDLIYKYLKESGLKHLTYFKNREKLICELV